VEEKFFAANKNYRLFILIVKKKKVKKRKSENVKKFCGFLSSQLFHF